MKKVRKNIDLSAEAVRSISVEAAKKGTNFKNLSEQILEDYAVRLAKKDKPK